MSLISSAFDVNVTYIVNDGFKDFRSFLIVSDNPDHVDVQVNVDNYWNCKFYNHNFQSKSESNSNSFKVEILFWVFSLMSYHIYLKHTPELRIKMF